MKRVPCFEDSRTPFTEKIVWIIIIVTETVRWFANFIRNLVSLDNLLNLAVAVSLFLLLYAATGLAIVIYIAGLIIFGAILFLDYFYYLDNIEGSLFEFAISYLGGWILWPFLTGSIIKMIITHRKELRI